METAFLTWATEIRNMKNVIHYYNDHSSITRFRKVSHAFP
jgi:hypothetical protein